MFKAGTLLGIRDIHKSIKIATLHNRYLKEVPEKIDFLTFVQQVILINHKLGQHFLAVAYPKKTLAVHDIENIFAGADLIDKKHNNKADLQDFITFYIASELTKFPFFNGIKIRVLTTPEQHRHIPKSVAYQQTGQPNPDFSLSAPSWHRYADLKAGHIEANKGHIYFSTDESLFAGQVKDLMERQSNSYHHHGKITYFIKGLLKDKSLTWDEKNTKLHTFYLDNYANYPDINPSLIFHKELSYTLATFKGDKAIDGLIHIASFDSQTKTEETIANWIIKGGLKGATKYVQDTGINMSIKEKIIAHFSDAL